MVARVLCDSWYAKYIANSDSFDSAMARECPRVFQQLWRKSGVSHGIMLFILSRSYDMVVAAQRTPGMWIFLLLESLMRRRKVKRVVLLEFTPKASGMRFVRSRIDRYFFQRLFQLCIRRCMRICHVLSPGEIACYSARYNVPDDAFRYIPWPMVHSTDQQPNFSVERTSTVLSSGRFSCDWETLFRAAEGRNWSLTVVCGRHDYDRVISLAKRVHATVYCRLSSTEHEKLLEAARVYVIALQEDLISCGQIRVMNAIGAGTPIVASDVLGLKGYLKDQETALLVPTGDHVALRQAVERLLQDNEEGRRLARNAYEVAIPRTMQAYLLQISELVNKEACLLEGEMQRLNTANR